MNKDFLLRLEFLGKSLVEFLQIFVEIYKGFIRRDARMYRAFFLALCTGVFILMEWDTFVFKKIQLFQFYPSDGWIFKSYAIFAMWLPILTYGALVRLDKKKFQQNLKEVFDLVGLKNSIGSYPRFLSLENLLEKTMRLRVTNGGFPKNEWESRKLRLEANMHIFIDEIKQVQERGIIEIIFSYEPMPKKISIEQMDRFQNYTFLLGRDRTREYLGDFNSSPHLLVAGETGGGKSAFMRQLITTIKYNQPESEFHLVDLKGGVEFGMFEQFPKMKVILEASKVPSTLATISGNLQERAKVLKDKRLTKIEEFFESHEYKKMTMEERSSHILGKRIFIVIDECAELFLFGSGKDAAQTKNIRASMSSITRLGRFAGIHVILGTQRPDKQAVDPQVKSNLPVTVCFRVHDLGGSLAVLGNGKATNLPNIPGRAILQLGSQEMEIQTPFLDFKEATRILEEKFPASNEAFVKEDDHEKEKTPKPGTIR